MAEPPVPSSPVSSYSRPAALLVAAAMFMQILDGAIINTSLPQMARSLGVGSIDLAAAITAYVLAAAAVSPLASWAADRFGPRNVLCAAFAAFAAASLWCALARGLPELVAARIAQGIGGALLTPVGTAVVMRNVAGADFLRASALMVWPALLAPVIGPAIGGFITDTVGWRWNFAINLPLGIAGMLAAWRIMPAEPAGRPRRLDVVGLLLCGTALCAGLAGLQRAASGGAERHLAGALVGVGLAAGWLAIRHLRRRAEPILPLTPLGRPSLRFAFAAGAPVRVVFAAAPFLLPLMLQIGFGLSASVAGGWMLVYFCGNLGIKAAATPLMRRFGFRRVLVVNGLAGGLSMLAIARLDAGTAPAVLFLVLLVAGACRSLHLTVFTTVIYMDVPSPERGAAANLAAMMLQTSHAAGVALAALALALLQGFAGVDPFGLAELQRAFVLLALALVVLTLAARPPRHLGVG